MLAIVRTPPTNYSTFRVVGNIDRETLNYLNNRFGPENVDIDDDMVDVMESPWFRKLSKKITPGTVLKTYRENMDLSQQQLAKKAGIAKASYISDIENGRRPVSKKLMMKFAGIFGVSAEMFL